MSSDFEGLPECDRTHCWDRCVPHRPAAPRVPLDSLLANQEQEEDAFIESNSAIGTSHVPLYQCLTGPFLFSPERWWDLQRASKVFQSVCEEVGLGFQGVGASDGH